MSAFSDTSSDQGQILGSTGRRSPLVDLVAGDACPKNLRHQFKVPYGRGLCVVKGDEKHGFACFAPSAFGDAEARC